MKKITVLLSLFLAAASTGLAQNYSEMKIWPDGLPNSNGADLTKPYDDATGNYEPTVRVYLPEKSKATGRAILCIPGGGYGTVVSEPEGYSWAPYFVERGIALIVLKYRLPMGNYASVPSTDAFEAMRIIRRHAKEWNIDPHKVGVMGHSAGGHLAATVATLAEGDARPDFHILFYAVTSMRDNMRTKHSGTKPNFMGLDAPADIVAYYSNDEQVTASTPPALIFTVDDDTLVPTSNSVNYYLALNRAGVPASLHIYPGGGHGFGGSEKFPYRKAMLDTLFSWLDTLP